MRYAFNVFLALAAWAALPPFSRAADEPLLAQALSRYEQARNGDTGQLDQAIADFEALIRAAPEHPLYAAYLGSAIALQGRDAWLPWNKLRYTEQGLDRLDRALAMLRPAHDRTLARNVPVGIETRLVAALTFIGIPDSLFHRRADAKRLIGELVQAPGIATVPAEIRATVYLTAARLARDEGRAFDERAFLARALAATTAGPQYDQARARLAELGQ